VIRAQGNQKSSEPEMLFPSLFVLTKSLAMLAARLTCGKLYVLMRSDRSPLPTSVCTAEARSAASVRRRASLMRAARSRRALALFWCCDRSSCHHKSPRERG